MLACELDGRPHAFSETGLDALELTDVSNPDVVAMKLGGFSIDTLREQPHQAENFVRGAPPVLCRKRVDGQDFDASIGARHGDAANVLGAGVVACQAR